jgi:uncharacterized damage-inducible protein DinB
MSIIHPILAELDHETRTTLRVLERVPNEHLDWSPHPRSMTLRKLAWHLAAIPSRVQTMLRQGTFDVGKAGPSEPPADSAGIGAALQDNVTELRAYLTTLDDETLKEPFTLTKDGQTILSIPKVAVIRNILLNHSYHHRGQLSVYLRLLDVPLPSIYGSTADEQM